MLRSAAQYDSGNYGPALHDIESALATQAYPSKLMHKLYLRKGFALKELGQAKRAEDAFSCASSLLDVSDLEDEKQEEIKDMINEAIKNICIKSSAENEHREEVFKLEKVSSPSANIQEFSDCLEVSFKPKIGRHITAKRDITVGEILAVEEATIWRLLPNPSLKKICCQCLTESWAPLPCRSCAAVSFCSEECRDAAWQSHHRWECAWSLSDLYQVKEGDDLACSSMFMAFRAMTLKNVDFFLKNKEIFEAYNNQHNVEDDNSKGSITEYFDQEKAQYRNLFNLVTHCEKGDEEFHLKNAVLTIFFISLLEQNFWFEEYASDDFNDDKQFIAKLVNHFICVVKFNTHQTGQFENFSLDSGYTATSIGQVIRPAMALLNHSCSPNIVRADRGRLVVAASCAVIQEGEEVTDSYGNCFMDEEKDERREKLRKSYWFRCFCFACKKRWPCQADLPANLFEVREIQLKIPRGQTDAYAALMDQYMKGIYQEMKKEVQSCAGDMVKATELWKLYYHTLSSVVTPPYLGYCKVFQGVRNCLWLGQGGKALYFYDDSKAMLR